VVKSSSPGLISCPPEGRPRCRHRRGLPRAARRMSPAALKGLAGGRLFPRPGARPPGPGARLVV